MDPLLKRLLPLPLIVIDDDKEVLNSLKAQLSKKNQVECFGDPLKALNAFKKREYSVAISDLQMEGLNGITLLENFSRIQPDCYRILLTAFSDLANITDTINKAHVNQLMTKPWHPEDLNRAVEMGTKFNNIQRENNELRRLAWSDSLTGLANKRYFWERLEAEVSRAERFKSPLSLIMADIDDFKKFNDTHGHQYGDEVLAKVAKSLDENRRSMDTVARFGGEEFAVVLPECKMEQASIIAQRQLKNCFKKTGIHLSFGVAQLYGGKNAAKDLVEKADRALLKAKEQGKARVICFSP